VKIYLDNSFLNRPFDDLSVGLNKFEQGVLFLIIQLVKKQKARLVNSSVIRYENSLNPFPERRKFVEKIMEQASENIDYSAEIRRRAAILEETYNFKPYDARHIASAETAKVDFFITCDYTLPKKYKEGSIAVITPLTFIDTYGKRYKK
jgi:predicted nucleic acid-binding protein